MSSIQDLAINEKHVKLAEIAKALSHPARVRIVEILAQRKTCLCGEIVELLPLSQSTVSQHLKELKKSGLIEGEVDGPRNCYCLCHETFALARAMFNQMFTKCCCTIK